MEKVENTYFICMFGHKHKSEDLALVCEKKTKTKNEILDRITVPIKYNSVDIYGSNDEHVYLIKTEEEFKILTKWLEDVIQVDSLDENENKWEDEGLYVVIERSESHCSCCGPTYYFNLRKIIFDDELKSMKRAVVNAEKTLIRKKEELKKRQNESKEKQLIKEFKKKNGKYVLWRKKKNDKWEKISESLPYRKLEELEDEDSTKCYNERPNRTWSYNGPDYRKLLEGEVMMDGYEEDF